MNKERMNDDLEIVSDGLLRIAEACDLLAISRSKLYALMDDGKLEFAQFGRSRRIPKRAVMMMAAQQLRGGMRNG